MPTAWRAHVIQEHLASNGIDAHVCERDLYSLDGGVRDAVLDAIASEGAEFPMVLVGHSVASTGGIDLRALVESAERAAQG